MAQTRIKICGMMRPEDAAKAAELGADAVGLNFVGGPRRLSWPQAYELQLAFSPPLFVDLIALMGSEPMPEKNTLTMDYLRSAIASAHYVQVYDYALAGSSPQAAIHIVGRPTWYVAHVAQRENLASLKAHVAADCRKGHLLGAPRGILFDTASSTKLGGTGETFNWHWIAEARAAGELDGLPPIILAGGLKPDNVAEAIRIAQPYAVDVSSGVEVAGKPGIKDPIKMRDFIQAVRGA